MAECPIEKVNCEIRYFDDIDVVRKEKLIAQFIIYKVEIKTGINFDLINYYFTIYMIIIIEQ